MSLVLRLVDKSFDVREEFLGFLYCKSGLSGKSLSETLLGAISELKLDINDCRGQGYDGAAAVSGSKNGMAAHIIKENPKAIYTHCFSHRLNLSICKTCKIQSVANIMEQIKELSYFFNFSEPRQLLLLECIELCAPDAEKRLKDVCRTCWIERINGMDIFEETFIPITYCLEKVKINVDNTCNRDT